MDERARQTITKYLGDMHGLINHGLQPLDRQSKQLRDANHPDAVRAVEDFKRTLESHLSSIESRMKAMGGSPTAPIKDAASSLVGLVAGLYNAVRTEEASKSIRDDYTFFSLGAISYLMLHTTAMGLGDEETARLAERGYRDMARMVMEVNNIMPRLVYEELRQDGLQVQDVTDQCHRLVHEAWNSDEVQRRFRAA